MKYETATRSNGLEEKYSLRRPLSRRAMTTNQPAETAVSDASRKLTRPPTTDIASERFERRARKLSGALLYKCAHRVEILSRDQYAAAYL